MISIRFSGVLSERVGGISSVQVPATTVESALRALTARHPELLRLIWTGEALNPVMAVFLNDKLLEPRHLETAVQPGDQIDILAAVCGG
jgi:molybdopterin converting factor small subunit